MTCARVQFDRSTHPHGEASSFSSFFRPILPRLRPFYWVCNYWPLRWPCSAEVEFALKFVEDRVTPPDTVLPEFADEIIGDRDSFFALASPPASADDFDAALRAAAQRDQGEWSALVPPPVGSHAFRQGQQRYLDHVAHRGSHTDRFLDEYPVEYAFTTNDGVWWIAARDPGAIDELRAYARSVPGMTVTRTVGFGMCE